MTLSLTLCYSSSSSSSSSSCLPFLRGAERLALQQQRKDRMSTGVREKWVEGNTQMGIACSVPITKFKIYLHTTSRWSNALQHLWHVHILKYSVALKSVTMQNQCILFNITTLQVVSFSFITEAEDVEPPSQRRRRRGRVLVVLSGRLVILLWCWSKNNKSQSASQHKHKHQLLPAWLFNAECVHIPQCWLFSLKP